MTYEEIIQKIKSLEIQGAEKIAVAAVEAFSQKLKITQDREALQKAYQELEATRPTEPALRNALTYCLANYSTHPDIANEVIAHFQNGKQKIAEYGAKKIQNGMIVFTHCHSSTVEAILGEAKKQGKNFTVYNTETRPRYQGRKTAENIAKMGIPVVHFVDSAARTFLKKADLFLFGCDAVTAEGKIFNKIGTEFIAEFALQNRIPSYSCTNSWKFDPQTVYGFEEVIEERDPKEVWDNPPAGVTIKNPAFEITAPDVVTGIITEIGIYKPEALILGIQNTIHGCWTKRLDFIKFTIAMNENDLPFLKLIDQLEPKAKCLRAQIACVIVKDNQVLVQHTNDWMKGYKCSEIGCIRNIMKVASGTRREICYGLCAEQWALSLAAKEGIAVEGATLYCTKHPCRICSSMIAVAGIKRVVYQEGYPEVLPNFDILKTSGIIVEQAPATEYKSPEVLQSHTI